MYSAKIFRELESAGTGYALCAETMQCLIRLADAVGATIIVPKLKSTSDSLISNFKCQINKLSADTVRQLTPEIRATLTSMDNSARVLAAGILLDVASDNSFYSNLYATLFVKCTTSWPIFSSMFYERFELYKTEVVQGIAGYRAFSLFVARLASLKWLPQDKVLALATQIQSLVDISESRIHSEEWAEHIYAWAQYGVIVSNESIESTVRRGVTSGMSPKAVFKYMDLMDKLGLQLNK